MILRANTLRRDSVDRPRRHVARGPTRRLTARARLEDPVLARTRVPMRRGALALQVAAEIELRQWCAWFQLTDPAPTGKDSICRTHSGLHAAKVRMGQRVVRPLRHAALQYRLWRVVRLRAHMTQTRGTRYLRMVWSYVQRAAQHLHRCARVAGTDSGSSSLQKFYGFRGQASKAGLGVVGERWCSGSAAAYGNQFERRSYDIPRSRSLLCR